MCGGGGVEMCISPSPGGLTPRRRRENKSHLLQPLQKRRVLAFNMEELGTTVRNGVRDLINASVCTALPVPGGATAQLGDAVVACIERGVFNWAIEYCDARGVVKNWKNGKFRTVYLAKARSVVANLRPDAYVSNQRLLSRLVEHEFGPKDIACMKPENVFPEVWKQVLDVKLMRDQYSEKPEAMTDQFRCGRCKKRECVYQELQLRSSDEPMTLFITCLNCGNRWRIG